MPKSFIKIAIGLLMVLLLSGTALAQSTVNYAFTYSNTGSLVDMSSGTTPLLPFGVYYDDVNSAVFNIGFTFWFMGAPYTQFSANSNGQMRLGGTAIAGIISAPVLNAPYIIPWSGDNAILASGKLHYKVTGSAPTRVLVVEWDSLRIPYGSTTVASQDQALLYEGTGVIEFRYGYMYENSTGTNYIFFSSSNLVNTVGSVFIAATPTYSTAATPSANLISASGPIPNLSSTADGSRWVYTFTPPSAPSDPSLLTFSNITTNSMRLNWQDNSLNELGFAIFRSNDGGVTYNYVGSVLTDTTYYNATGLSIGTTYYWRVYSFTEGQTSNALQGSQATGVGTVSGTKWIINGYTATDTYPSFTAAFTDLNTNLVGPGGVVFNVPAGQATFYETPPTLTATGSPALPVTFQKTGVGTNPLIVPITAGTKTTATIGYDGDGIIKIAGGDNFTFDAIDVRDTFTSSGLVCREYGYYLVKASGTDACKNITIRNCVTKLKKVPTYSAGICISNNDNAGLSNIVVTSEDGRSENIFIYSNTIDSSYNGIVSRGYADVSPYALYDQNIQIGVMAGNTISNIGGAVTQPYGFYGIYYNNLKFNNNMISGGAGTTTTMDGIMASTAVNANIDIIGNDITLATNATTTSLYGIYCGGGATGSTNTVNIKKNVIHDITWATQTSGIFYGIYELASGIINNNVDSNTVRNITMGTATSTGTFYGMYPYYGTNQNVRYNVVRNITLPGTGLQNFYGIYAYYGLAGGNKEVSSDTVRDISLNGTGSFYGIYSYYGTNVNYSNNKVYNCIRSTGISGLMYLNYVYYPTTLIYANNQIYNCGGTAATFTGAVYGCYTTGSATSVNNYGNNIHNLYANGAGIVYGMYSSCTGPTHNVYNNVVDTLYSGGSTVYGIYVLAGAPGYTYNNYVFNLASGAVASLVYGMYVGGGTTMYLYNNMIADLRAPLATGVNAINGLYIGAGTTVSAYYNSVHLYATSTGPTFGTSAVYASTTPTVDLRDNVFVNNSAAGGGIGSYTVAYRRSLNALGTYAATSNNNLFWAGAPSATNVIFYDGVTTYPTLALYQALVTPRDAASVTENPPFITPSNLHISLVIPTLIESGAIPITAPIIVNNDFDYQPRNAVNPDIGCDEGNFILLDIMPPAIVYTPARNTISTAGYLVTATITDVTGVDVSPLGQPRLYYRTGAVRPIAAPYGPAVLGLPAGPPNAWNFPIPGQPLGTWVEYYIAAQDIVAPPNGGTAPSGGGGTNPPGTIPPAAGRLFAIRYPLDFTVGAVGADFVTLTEGLGILSVGVDSSARLLLNSDYSSATEVFPLAIAAVPGLPSDKAIAPKANTSAPNAITTTIDYKTGKTVAPDATTIDYMIGETEADAKLFGLDNQGFVIPGIGARDDGKDPNYLTIRPNTLVTATISGASASSQIFRISSSYITIDGSNSGGTDRSLTIQNTSITTPQVIAIAPGAVTLITNVTVKNCVIINGANTSTAVVVGNPGNFNNITIQNNSIQLAYIGIYVRVNPTTPGIGSILITGNDLNSPAPSAIRLVGIYCEGTDGAMVTNNNIGKFAIVDAANVTGIWAALGVSNSTISGNIIDSLNGAAVSYPRGMAISTGVTNSNLLISGNTISRIWTAYSSPPYGIYVFSTTTGVVVEKNKVSDINNTNTGGYGARGINIVTGVAASNILLCNNFVWNVWATSDAFTTYYGVGIAIDGATGGVGVYYNSVYLYGSYAGYASATVHAAFAVMAATVTALNVRDNIFVNTFDNTNGVGDKSYAINSQAANTAFTDIDYNDYYVGGSAGVLGYLGADQLTLGAWQLATAKDANSISADPIFVSNTDLHIQTTATVVNRGATPIAGITTDIDGNTRHPARPDIGADEYNPNAPAAFSLLSPSNLAINQPLAGQLVWYKSTDATHYDVYLGLVSPGNLISQLQTDTFYNYFGLNPTATYFWQVVALNDTLPLDAGNTPSAIWSFGTVTPPPGPSNLLLSNITSTSMDLAWTDLSSNELGFYIRRDVTASGSFPKVDSVGVSVTTYSDLTLTPATHYYYRVSAYNLQGESPFAGNNDYTRAAVPGTPTFGNVGPYSMRVFVDPVTNSDSAEFVVRVVYGANTRYLNYATGTVSVTEVWGSYAQFGGAAGIMLTGLTSSTNYTFDVKARNGALIETGYGSSAIQRTTAFHDVGVVAIVRPNLTETKRVPFTPIDTITNLGDTTENIPVIAVISGPYITEGFNTVGSLPAGWTSVILNGTYNWAVVASGSFPTTVPYEGAAMLTYQSWSASSGYSARLISPSLSLGATPVPLTLKFWMVHDNGYAGYTDRVVVEYSTDGVNFNPVDSFMRYQNVAAAWFEHTVNMGIRSGTFYLGFRAVSNYGNNMYCDYGTLLAPVWRDSVLVTVAPGFDKGKGLSSMALNNPTDKEEPASGLDVSAVATFRPCTLNVEGSYPFLTYTALSTDMNSSNNQMTRTFTVSPATLTLVSPSNGSSTFNPTPTFTWNAVPNVTRYRIEVDNTPGFPSPEFLDSMVTVASATPTTPLAGGLYYWHVRAERPGTPDPYSAAWTLTISALAAPTLNTPLNNDTINATPTFNWNTVSGANFYRLQIDTVNTFPTPTVVNQAGNSYTPGANMLDDHYYWRVAASADGGTTFGAYSTIYQFELDAAIPIAPTLVAPVDGATGVAITPTFSWNPVTFFGKGSDAASLEQDASLIRYRIQVYTDTLGTAVADDSTSATTLVCPVTLDSGTTYYWHARAADAAGNVGQYSGYFDFTTVIYTPPSGWVPMKDILAEPSTKKPKSGTCMAALNGEIYILKASNTQDFAKFTPGPSTGAMTLLDTIPKGLKADGDGKRPKKGASMASYNDTKLFVLRGNNTPGFWKYVVTAGPGETLGWKKLTNIPTGAKNPKDASGMVAITKGGNDYIFTMKGSKTDEFYLYDIAANTWAPTPTKPTAGTSTKVGYKKGSCLAYDRSNYVYILKGSYGDMFRYSVASDSFVQLKQFNYKTFINRLGKKKKVGEGSGMVYYNNDLYILKGGNTTEFWRYQIVGDTYVQMDSLWDIPAGGGKRVKAGGGLTMLASGTGAGFYAAKGANTQEFFYHTLPSFALTLKSTNDNQSAGTMDNNITTNNFKLTIAPNPAIKLTAVHYSLPKPEPVSFKLYDVTGSAVRTYANTNPTQNGVWMIDAKTLPVGVYILRFDAGEIRVTRKIVLQK